MLTGDVLHLFRAVGGENDAGQILAAGARDPLQLADAEGAVVEMVVGDDEIRRGEQRRQQRERLVARGRDASPAVPCPEQRRHSGENARLVVDDQDQRVRQALLERAAYRSAR